MRKKLFEQLLFVFLAAMFLSACTSDTLVPEVVSPYQPVSFANDIQPIFDQGCNNSGCHFTGMVPPDLTPGKSYNSLMSANLIDTLNPGESVLYTVTKSGGSMSNYCTPSQAQLILNWITQGAKNN